MATFEELQSKLQTIREKEHHDTIQYMQQTIKNVGNLAIILNFVLAIVFSISFFIAMATNDITVQLFSTIVILVTFIAFGILNMVAVVCAQLIRVEIKILEGDK